MDDKLLKIRLLAICLVFYLIICSVSALGALHEDNNNNNNNNHDAIHDTNIVLITNNTETQQRGHGYHNADNESNHDNADNHHDNHSSGHGAGGIHVASWNFDYVRQPLIIALFLIIAAICKLGFHHADFLSSIVPESCLLIILGTVVGAILHGAGVDKSGFANFSSELFFLTLLPPIILESAFSLHDRVFADNIGTVLLYAVIGTILNFFIIGSILYGLAECGAMGAFQISFIQCLLFSSLIVAVDPVAVLAIFQEIGVNNVLYFLVFGESLLNDAVTVVIYNMMKAFNHMDTIPPSQVGLGVASFFSVSLGGLGIGVIYGILSALVTKMTTKVRVVEPLAIFTLAYLSYLTAELFHFSGIISIIGCGLTQAQYSFHNISHKSYTTITYFSKMMSATCDCIIFMFLGLALVRDDHKWHTGFILWSIVICLVIRFIVVYFLTFLANKVDRLRIIDMEEQFIMAYGGLRGAVAFSLVAMLDKSTLSLQPFFQTATLAIIIFTVFVQGITIKPLVRLLRIKKSSSKVVSIYEEINCHVTDHVMAGIEEIVGHHGHNFFREVFDRFDDKYLKFWLQKNPKRKDDQIMDLYNKIALKQHYENLAGTGPMDDYFGSDMQLYICPNGVGDDISFDDISQMTDDPDFIHRSMEIHRDSIYSIGSEAYPLSPRRKSSLFTFFKFKTPITDEEKSVTKDNRKCRRRILFDTNKLKRENSQDADDEDDIQVNDFKKWIVKPRDYQKKYHDRNLTLDGDNDLLHHLHEKRRRTVRMRRASVLSPTSSLSQVCRSMPGSPTGLRSIQEDDIFGTDGSRPPGVKNRRFKPRQTRAHSVDQEEKRSGPFRPRHSRDSWPSSRHEYRGKGMGRSATMHHASSAGNVEMKPLLSEERTSDKNTDGQNLNTVLDVITEISDRNSQSPVIDEQNGQNNNVISPETSTTSETLEHSFEPETSHPLKTLPPSSGKDPSCIRGKLARQKDVSSPL